MTRTRDLRPLAFVFLWLVSAALQGCRPSAQELPAEIAGVPRKTLVRALAELRAAALRSPDWQLDRATRDSILASFGLTEEAVLAVAETRGGDLNLMARLWEEVDSVLRARRAETVPGLVEGHGNGPGPAG